MAPRCRHVVVLDCDGTLTPKGKALLPVIDVRAVTPEATASLQALRDKYLARALSGELSPAQERDWLAGCPEIYVPLGLNPARGCSAGSAARRAPPPPPLLGAGGGEAAAGPPPPGLGGPREKGGGAPPLPPPLPG